MNLRTLIIEDEPGLSLTLADLLQAMATWPKRRRTEEPAWPLPPPAVSI
jgi:hypothetical protein